MSDHEEPGRQSDPSERPAADPQVPGQQVRDAEARRREQELDRIQTELDEVESFRMPLMDHLIELKNRILWAVVAVGLGTGAGLVGSKPAYALLSQPYIDALTEKGIDGSLVILSPFEGIYVYFKVAIIVGLLLASPVVSYQAWQFIAPGLYKSEKRAVLPLSLSSAGLFLLGAAFCFYGIFPYAFPFFITVLDVQVTLSADAYLSAVTRMMLAFGACFQVPVVSFFLARVGLIDEKDMMGFFRYAVVVIFVLAAIITPPDPLTQVLLAVPMVLLYGIGIVIAWVFTTKGK